MQPCRFIRDEILKPLKTILLKGYLFRTHLVILRVLWSLSTKKNGGVRMTVDYREVNMQLETTANQLPNGWGATLLCYSGQSMGLSLVMSH